MPLNLRAPLKHTAFRVIRLVHLLLLRRDLPPRVGIYGHSLEPADYGALAAVVAYLKAHGYRFTNPEEFLAPGADLRVFLSFDDNFRSWFSALQFLESLNISVTFYVNAGPLRDVAGASVMNDYFDRVGHRERESLSREELRAVAHAGHTIGSHTDWHYPLTKLPFDEAAASVLRGRTLLQDLLSQEIPHFSYPFGMRRYFNEELADYCFDNGIRTIAAGIPGMQHATQTARCIHRSLWPFDRSLPYNLDSVRIDGRYFEALTGRSAVGIS